MHCEFEPERKVQIERSRNFGLIEIDLPVAINISKTQNNCMCLKRSGKMQESRIKWGWIGFHQVGR